MEYLSYKTSSMMTFEEQVKKTLIFKLEGIRDHSSGAEPCILMQ